MSIVKSFQKTNLYFFTATNLNWKHILADEVHKSIVIDSLRFLAKDGRIKVIGYVIMPNHIHLIWQILRPNQLKDVQRDFLKFTAQKIKNNIEKTKPGFLQELLVNAKDRKYQIWERNAHSFEINNVKTLLQKLNYIHLNPTSEKWKLVSVEENYTYSSARFYMNGADAFDFLTHFDEVIEIFADEYA